jgi:shikimate dehydrogenase
VSGRVVRLAVLGDPLRYTRSPELHRAGLAAVGMACVSRAIPTPIARLGERLHMLRADGVHGVNLTIPLKERALEHLDRVSDASRAARSVNTVGFAADGSWGDTTDGAGFVAWLERLGRDPRQERVHLLATGGAARSLARALREAGAEVSASARRPESASADLFGTVVAWRGEAEAARLAAATVIVNASPLEDPNAIVPLDRVAPAALVVDLRYGPEPTPLVTRARSLGREAHDGLGLLVHQARASLAAWLGMAVPLEPLERAVKLTR